MKCMARVSHLPTYIQKGDASSRNSGRRRSAVTYTARRQVARAGMRARSPQQRHFEPLPAHACNQAPREPMHCMSMQAIIPSIALEGLRELLDSSTCMEDKHVLRQLCYNSSNTQPWHSGRITPRHHDACPHSLPRLLQGPDRAWPAAIRHHL